MLVETSIMVYVCSLKQRTNIMKYKLLLLTILIPVLAAGQSGNRTHGPSANNEMFAEATSSEVEMPFFLSGKSFAELERLDENSGEYFALGREYIAAGRNFMSYPIPENVLKAFNEASVLLTIHTPSEVTALPYNDLVVTQFRETARILSGYNKCSGTTNKNDCKGRETAMAEDEFFDTDLSQWIYHKTLKKSKITRLY